MDVFVVEDSSVMRHRLVAALEEAPGVRVVGVADGMDQSIAEITSLRPRLVVLDLRLAQGNGLFVLHAAKLLEPPPVVAVLTNYPYEQYRTRCAQLGADHFFDKAKGLDGLFEVVHRLAGEPRREGARA
jgi:DNA-binding NarL/FixJ family response regulator